jgi:hypothetical protein
MKRKLLGALLAVVGLLLLSMFALSQATKVPPEAIRTKVIRTPALIERAWALPAAAALKHELLSQSNPSVCGPSSLANVFRSLHEAAVSETMVLEGTGQCRTGMCFGGLTLDQLADVARHHTQHKVTVLRNLTPEAFRDELRRSNEPHLRYTINFTRKAIFGAGGGHHSPIGGYLEPEDLVFVLDVNHDFGPWLVERTRLFAAMDTKDGDQKRGMLRIE